MLYNTDNVLKKINVKLELKETPNIKNTLDFFSIKRKVALETKKECFLTEIDRIMVYDTFIVIIDQNYPLPYIFNDQGKFLYTIGKRGHGPGEIDDNVCTTLQDSILSILSFPQNVIYEYSISNHLLREVDLKKNNYYFTTCYRLGMDYYLSFRSVNPHMTLLGFCETNTLALTKLWTIGKEEWLLANPKQYKVYKSLNTILDTKIFMCFTNDYKIHCWDKTEYQGYYTNEFYDYDFFEITKEFNEEEFEELYVDDWIKSNSIQNIFTLKNDYLIVRIKVLDRNDMKRWRENYDIFDIKKGVVYSGIDNPIFALVGWTKDEIITTLPDKGFDDRWNTDNNPNLYFYRFQPEKLEESGRYED